MDAVGQYLFIFITVYAIVIELEAVTVSPFLCPTNKIVRNPRTLDLLYNLLDPSRPQRQVDLFSELQEQLQQNDRDNCRERQGFGKKDLSLVTRNGLKKNSERQDRKYTAYSNPPYIPGPNIPPYTPRRPLQPTGPRNNLEGKNASDIYEANEELTSKSDIKPVWENILEPPPPEFRLDLIGGPFAFIVGFSSRRPPTGVPPTEGPLTEEPLREDLPLKESSAAIQFPQNNQQGRSTGIIRSFANLLFN